MEKEIGQFLNLRMIVDTSSMIALRDDGNHRYNNFTIFFGRDQ